MITALNRNEFLLQAMHLNHWQLVKPECLKGVVNLPVSEVVQLILVAENPVDLSEPIVQDLLRSLDLNAENCLCITFDFVLSLNISHEVNFLLFSDLAPENLEHTLSNSLEIFHKIKTTLPAKKLWHSASLAEFKNSPQAKRNLWQQLMQ